MKHHTLARAMRAMPTPSPALAVAMRRAVQGFPTLSADTAEMIRASFRGTLGK